jgi:hypothetical protein
MTKEIVIVFINGFGIQADWKPFDPKILPDHVRFISVTPSSTASLHDRCCHIFSELKGGRVHFGKEHSSFHGHSPYGEVYREGLYPEWNEDNPVILIGHSMGGLTALAFQKYLNENKFEGGSGFTTSSNWVSGVITVNSPLRGALRVYAMGMNSYQTPMVEVWTIGYLLGLAIHFTEFFNGFWWKKYIFSSGHEHWQMEFTNKPFFSLLVFFLSFCGYGIHTNTDNLGYDASLSGADAWSQYMEYFPNSFYFSIVANVHNKQNGKNIRRKSIKLQPPHEQVAKTAIDELLFAELSSDSEEEDDKKDKDDNYTDTDEEQEKDSVPVKRSPFHHTKRFRLFHYFLRKFMQIDHEAHKLPTKVREEHTLDWMDAGHDGLIDVYSQRQPNFRSRRQQKKFSYEFINCWKRKTSNGSLESNNKGLISNNKLWETGKLYITQVHSCHLAPVFHCPKTWKVIWKMVHIINKNHRKQQAQQQLQLQQTTPLSSSQSSFPKTPSSRPSNKSSISASEKLSRGKPDQQQPHMHFRYHYHHNYYHHQHYKNALTHLIRCVQSNSYHLSIFTCLLIVFGAYCLFRGSSSTAQSPQNSHSLLFFFFSHLSLVFANVSLFYMSEADIDYIEKMIVSFSFYRLVMIAPSLFSSSSISSVSTVFPFSWLCVNQFLEILGVYCLSNSYDGGHSYQYSHNKKLNNIYNYLCFPKVIMHLFAYFFLRGQHYLTNERKTDSLLLFMKIYCCYTVMTGLSPLLWQFIHYFRHYFGAQVTTKKSQDDDLEEDQKPQNIINFAPLSFTQLTLCYTTIISHVVHHCLWAVLVFQLMKLMFSHFFGGNELSFLSSWQIIGFSICMHLVISYNYINLSNNLQFTLIKLHFWSRHLAKYFLAKEKKTTRTMTTTESNTLKSSEPTPLKAHQKLN